MADAVSGSGAGFAWTEADLGAVAALGAIRVPHGCGFTSAMFWVRRRKPLALMLDLSFADRTALLYGCGRGGVPPPTLGGCLGVSVLECTEYGPSVSVKSGKQRTYG